MLVHPLACGYGYCFLLEDPHGLYLIDTGTPDREAVVLTKMKELGRTDLKVIWITHAHIDHYGSAAALRRLTGTPIGVHPADAGTMASGQSPLGVSREWGFIYYLAQPILQLMRPIKATPPDFTLEDGDTLESYGLNASILHTPGHMPGHTCVLLEDGTAFAADLIARSPRLGLQFLMATDWSQLPASLAKLKAARPEIVYTGHSRIPISGADLQMITP